MNSTDLPFAHTPVMSEALIQGLALQAHGHYLDATVGGGGHSHLILSTLANTRVTALDRDAQALYAARQRLQAFGDRVQFWHGNFADYNPGNDRFDGILADLGVSSAQLDRPERGFSFRAEAPLDMRMDQRQVLTAAELINHGSETELADIFFHYGEERYARRIARRIVARRPFTTTTELAAAIAAANRRPTDKSSRPPRIHPATRVFQALRIAVNQELTAVETFLQRAPDWLTTGGRIGIISFHSLEDRQVKHHFRADPRLKVLTKKPIIADPNEIFANPRSRSAKLRIAVRVAQESLPNPSHSSDR
ncbi:16S rRNA (cytosine(1402)-N(4))-methyltransferase RsmH [Synechococcales cyanobacterium C]|uniref:Ribosomal RNA small subunit methyltransferase H n=2 Tax=Petrachloros TaxID=2918834 RepID=A0A8K1ZX45_9CYAN|nr:16S rRNA (cytosine(1402)-N(4))-methyltransferase RsmH [Petrachloros mirabilis]NCJ05492.1 16S rRNA (cytosine(1402)-N(4))-methyltransferase RsmH [Petrachloros mirabilis ULC683]